MPSSPGARPGEVRGRRAVGLPGREPDLAGAQQFARAEQRDVLGDAVGAVAHVGAPAEVHRPHLAAAVQRGSLGRQGDPRRVVAAAAAPRFAGGGAARHRDRQGRLLPRPASGERGEVVGRLRHRERRFEPHHVDGAFAAVVQFVVEQHEAARADLDPGAQGETGLHVGGGDLDGGLFHLVDRGGPAGVDGAAVAGDEQGGPAGPALRFLRHQGESPGRVEGLRLRLASGRPVEAFEVGLRERAEVGAPVDHGRQARVRGAEDQGDAVAAQECPGSDLHVAPSKGAGRLGCRHVSVRPSPKGRWARYPRRSPVKTWFRAVPMVCDM